MPIYRYKNLGVDVADLQNSVPGALAVGATAPPTYVDIDAEAFAKADLDVAMQDLAWQYVETDPGNTPAQAASVPGRNEDLSTPGPDAGVAILGPGGVSVIASDRVTLSSRVTAFYQAGPFAPQGGLFLRAVDETAKTFTVMMSSNPADENLPIYWQLLGTRPVAVDI